MKNKIKLFAAAGLAVFITYLCIYYWPGFSSFIGSLLAALTPLVVGGILAYILNLVMSFYERHFFPKSKSRFVAKIRRPFCIAGAFLTVAAIVALVVVLVVPQLVKCIELIIAEVPVAFQKSVEYIAGLNIISKKTLQNLTNINWEGTIEKVWSALTVGIGGAMNVAVQIVSAVFSGVVTTFLGIIFAIYILASKDKIFGQIRRTANQYLGENRYGRLSYLRTVLDDCFHKYIVGQCVEAVILGSLCAVGMLVLRLPYAPMISALIAFTALIPVAGAYIGAGLGAFIILIDSPVKALVFLIFIVVLQQLEGNLVYPKVVGNSVGLPAIWVLAAVTIGGGIMGVVGMLLSVPLAAAIYRLIKQDVIKRENSKIVVSDEGEAE